MSICNACRYCEGYCAVFPAMERRLTFGGGDLAYLANLCHNCGECLYACQYAPPHEFAVNVPRTLARIRFETYQAYAWPRLLARMFERQGVATSLLLSIGLGCLLWALAVKTDGAARVDDAQFYAVIPHHVLVGVFGGVFGLAVAILAVGLLRFWRHADEHPLGLSHAGGWIEALRDILTLRNLHAHGADCTYAGEEQRSPWRRRCHHLTYYGFLLCFASTSVAAVYHSAFGWEAPYGYLSVPVLLGTAGGVGLTAGPLGLLWLRRGRDADLSDPAQRGADVGFSVLLVLSSVSGLALLAGRGSAAMPQLLVAHLGTVLALFVTLPYGKFVHGVYRSAALLKNALENRRPEAHVGSES